MFYEPITLRRQYEQEPGRQKVSEKRAHADSQGKEGTQAAEERGCRPLIPAGTRQPSVSGDVPVLQKLVQIQCDFHASPVGGSYCLHQFRGTAHRRSRWPWVTSLVIAARLARVTRASMRPVFPAAAQGPRHRRRVRADRSSRRASSRSATPTGWRRDTPASAAASTSGRAAASSHGWR